MAGGQATITVTGATSGGLGAKAQTHGFIEAELTGPGRLALVAPGTDLAVVSVATTGAATQTVSIEWTPAAVVTKVDGVIVETIAADVPDSALAPAVLADGVGATGASLTVDRVTVATLASCVTDDAGGPGGIN
ncbi:MAG: hypothetical protein AAF962_21520 [Actinomycetota bacterium]